MHDRFDLVRPDETGALPIDWMTLAAAVAFLAVATMFAVGEYQRTVSEAMPALIEAAR